MQEERERDGGNNWTLHLKIFVCLIKKKKYFFYGRMYGAVFYYFWLVRMEIASGRFFRGRGEGN